MAIRGFQTHEWDKQAQQDSSDQRASAKDSALLRDAQERLRKANAYFDKHPPRQSSQAEIAEFLRKLRWSE